MAKNYFIGIGGTGARVAEALVHICAAGYGPDELSLFLIDPDSGNGNLNRTKKRIGTYQDCRKDLESQVEAQRIPLFRTKLKTPSDPNKLVWGVLNKDATLREEVGLNSLGKENENPALADFIRVLYTEEELATELDEGFRGHPSIGSVLMADQDDRKDPWQTFWKDVSEAPRKPDAVRVFLAGSVFGGTGAAGVPTLGHPDVMKRREEAALGDAQSKITLGGALVLPYFRIGAASNGANGATGEMYVTKEDFPIATKAALQYYEDCIERGDLAFDQLYLIGDSLDQNVGDFSPGAGDQENRPHYVEVVTALSAFDFFEQTDAEEHDEKQRHFIAYRDDESVRWDSFPFSRDPDKVRGNQSRFEQLMATMTVFCYLLCTHGETTLVATAREDVFEKWYNENFSSNIFSRMLSGQSKEHLDPTKGENEKVRENVVRYANNFLAWISAMDDDKVFLIDRKALAESGTAGEVTLRDPQQREDSLGALFKGRSSKQGTFGRFRQILDAVRVENKNMSGAERYVTLFYRAARGFCDEQIL